jgi:adenylate cyclase
VKLPKVKELAASVGVALLAGLLAVLAVQNLSFLTNLENVAGDLRVAGASPPLPQSEDIVIAAIDEGTLSQFPYRSPVDREFLANLISSLEKKGAKVIGVDVILDQTTEEAKDKLLYDTLRATKTPMFVSYSSSPNIVNETQLEYLNAFVPENLRAEANLLQDPLDLSVRWVNPGGTTALRPAGFVTKALQLAGASAPTTADEIAWRSQPDIETPAFKTYPASAVPMLPDVWFKDKIVLVGAILSITDRHRTPLIVLDDGDRGMMPGVLIQAHGIAQFLENRTTGRLSLTTNALITLLFAGLGLSVSLFKKGIGFNVGVGAAIIAAYWVGAFYGYQQGAPMVPLIGPTLAFALSIWMMDVLIGRGERKQRQFVQGAFSRYVSPAVVNQLVADPSAVSISGIKREATFIFTDVAGFTTLSEQLTSEELSNTLNDYLDGACAIILRYEGTIDKFIGDAIMSIFNAPILQPDHAERAVKCALELDAYAEEFRKARNAEGIPIGVTRIGIHTGSATIGNFGSSSRMDFTALGDTVNTAARTEGVNKYFGTRLAATQETVEQCPNLKFRPIGDIVLKGKTKPTPLYNPIAETDDPALISDYEAAYALLRAEDPASVDAMKALGERFPDDPIVKFHLGRIAKGLVTARVVMEDK